MGVSKNNVMVDDVRTGYVRMASVEYSVTVLVLRVYLCATKSRRSLCNTAIVGFGFWWFDNGGAYRTASSAWHPIWYRSRQHSQLHIALAPRTDEFSQPQII